MKPDVDFRPTYPLSLHVDRLYAGIEIFLRGDWSVITFFNYVRDKREDAELQGYVFSVVCELAIQQRRAVRVAVNKALNPEKKYFHEQI